MSSGFSAILFFGTLMLFLSLGVPLTFALGGVGTIYAFFFFGPEMLYIVSSKLLGIINSFSLLTIPLFILMASILQRSGIARDLYRVIHTWFGGLRGGLSAGTIVIGAVIAAMAGVSGAATVSLGIIALPAMLDAKYDKIMVSGAIQAGGALGILIPPSIAMIIFAIYSEISIGKLFIAGVLPGLLLVVLFIGYILIRCGINPQLGPPIPKEKRATIQEKFLSLKGIFLPLVIIIGVLGSIYSGIATPTESASVGVVLCLVAAAVNRELDWKLAREASLDAFKLTSMIMWILYGSYVFTAIYHTLGASEIMRGLLLSGPGGRWGTLIIMQLTFFVLGMFLDPSGIIMITAPLFVPIAAELGFDMVWYGILFVVNMEMAYLTPPFGFNLFYMKSIVPANITMSDIYRSVIPFVGLQALGLAIIAIWPQIALFLPRLLD